MTTQVLPMCLVDELVGLWPTVCHGFSNEYFAVRLGVNGDGMKWLVFHYDYSDEVGPSTYTDLAVPVEKISRDVTRATQLNPGARTALSVAAVSVEPRRRGYVGDPRVPCTGTAWPLIVTLTKNGHVSACCAAGTKFIKGLPTFPPPLHLKFRHSASQQDALPLDITRENLAATGISLFLWEEYILR